MERLILVVLVLIVALVIVSNYVAEGAARLVFPDTLVYVVLRFAGVFV